MRRDVERFLSAKSVAVVGASDRRGPHLAVIGNLLAARTTAWGVNPRREEVLGLPCVPSCRDLPAAPDIALLLVGHERILEAAKDALSAGARALIAPGLGPEAGSKKRSITEGLVELAEASEVPLLGPNCMGVAVPGGTSAWIGTLGEELLSGNVAAVVQSGSIGEALAALGERVGFRCIVSAGAEQARDAADFCSVLASDERTAAVGLFLEAVRRPQAMRLALEELAQANKPVVCLRAGKSPAGARATAAHTDAMLTPERAFAALARHVNLIEVNDFGEFVETLELLGHRRRPQGIRIAGVTQSGGQAALMADLADEAGAELPEIDEDTQEALRQVLPEGMSIANPLDGWAIDGTADVYGKTFDFLGASGHFDALVLQWDQSPFIGEVERNIADKVTDEFLRRQGGACPIIVSGQAAEPLPSIAAAARRADVPLLRDVRAAVRAIVGVGRWHSRTFEPGDEPAERIELPPGRLGEVEAADLLADHGIRFARIQRAESEGEALEIAAEFGYPVVVKAVEAGHRSELGLIRLDLSSSTGLKAAVEEVGLPVLVAEQAQSGEEFYLGGKVDPEYGPIVCLSRGGTGVEESRLVACALAPIRQSRAEELLLEVVGGGPLTLSRRAELTSALVDFSHFVAGLPATTTVDVNPIVLRPDGSVIAVDALIVSREDGD